MDKERLVRRPIRRIIQSMGAKERARSICNVMQGILDRKIFMTDARIEHVQSMCSQVQAVPSITHTAVDVSDGAGSECNSHSPPANTEASSDRILLVNFTPEQAECTKALPSYNDAVGTATIDQCDWVALIPLGAVTRFFGDGPQVLTQRSFLIRNIA